MAPLVDVAGDAVHQVRRVRLEDDVLHFAGRGAVVVAGELSALVDVDPGLEQSAGGGVELCSLAGVGVVWVVRYGKGKVLHVVGYGGVGAHAVPEPDAPTRARRTRATVPRAGPIHGDDQ